MMKQLFNVDVPAPAHPLTSLTPPTALVSQFAHLKNVHADNLPQKRALSTVSGGGGAGGSRPLDSGNVSKRQKVTESNGVEIIDLT